MVQPDGETTYRRLNVYACKNGVFCGNQTLKFRIVNTRREIEIEISGTRTNSEKGKQKECLCTKIRRHWWAMKSRTDFVLFGQFLKGLISPGNESKSRGFQPNDVSWRLPMLHYQFCTLPIASRTSTRSFSHFHHQHPRPQPVSFNSVVNLKKMDQTQLPFKGETRSVFFLG